MVERPEVLAIIPARGGSKGIPGKNIREFAGYPLIVYSIAAGKQAGRGYYPGRIPPGVEKAFRPHTYGIRQQFLPNRSRPPRV
jgi:hypothetical protein